MSKVKMHDDEIEIDINLLRQLLEAQFPKWAKLPVEPVPSSGTDNAIFRLGAVMCARMPRVESAAKNIEKEHVWLPRLSEKLPLPVPTPLERGDPCKSYPWHWSICRWVEGEDAAKTPIADLAQCASDLAQFISSLHRIDPTGGPRSYRGGPLAAQDAEVRDALGFFHGAIDTSTLTAIWDECLSAKAWDKPPVWTHGDLLPTNLLIEEKRLCAVIDFDLMGIGDPACDLIVAWSVLSKDTRPIFRASLGVDDATWMRGRGWALSIALIIIPYYQTTNPGLVAVAWRMINEILADKEV